MPQASRDLKKKRSWQEALSDLVTDPKELLTLLELHPDWLDAAYAAARLFPLKTTRSFVARMQKGNPHDPLLRQILPLGIELQESEGFERDPLKEANVNPVPGLLHKYAGRVLVTLTSACAVHCRYCFRRHFPYAENNPGRAGWEKMITYITADKTISEVILSGGDPLAANDRLLKQFTDQLVGIPHIKRLRIHTRLPVVLPERITQALIEWMVQVPFDTVMVIHANHPQEISSEVKAALLSLRQAGICVLNQTVLLRAINDRAETLIALSEILFEAGVLPYYLHVLDKVQGAAHFDLERDKAFQLHAALGKALPGYLVPRLVCEEPGKASKTVLSTALFTG
ncbi:EF-P beta-lysylation protein EpmB [Aquicella lusitana]|uniref:L-lysine 2,3-aminomutase n=1 Tax=Aquicella lusitana TaxID=254246 RepID=A0A370GC70_9COXI|nr:EF-P beta-lysylation protein EpmB [Aquicella lusitana]RDI40054.1 L-lysine 2,3-aminomutase [Aquicella lusitana]VVC72335.1 L-lysine 2,3-aminomutase [Aquicella lusitana]